jgi:hypothetical protein
MIHNAFVMHACMPAAVIMVYGYFSGEKIISCFAAALWPARLCRLQCISQELLPNQDVNARSSFIPIWQKLPDWVVWLNPCG